ncbi:MAG: Xaa-Pro peptidase family protein [Actinobacteria bacterium]|nr:Xaa-Pro peptidase family protein [Actinomycetota bacterium]MBU1942597.1 Xaa-Pro peptidase family protein [Actinomycetota bacterium]MBU2688727.1 Xaa-Pro peptidase family protein [Actinomycetota bacterium]
MMTFINFPRRIASFQDELKNAGIDVLVGTKLKTITHMSGGFVPWRSVVIVPAEGEVQLITSLLDAGRLKEESWLDNVVGYGGLPGMDFLDMISLRINELGLAKGVIGYESGTSNYLPDGFITLYEYEQLRERFPDATFRNAVELMDRFTLVKEPEEIKLMRQATAICDTAHEEVHDALRVGISEKEIAGIAEAVMRDLGSQFAWTFTGGQEIASGYRTWWFWGGCTPATDKRVQCGEPVMIDLHGMYWLMLGDVAHNAIMGRPSLEQREVIDAYTKVCYKVVEEMQPGRSLAEVTRNCNAFVQENGWGEWVLPGYGHGIGHFGHEWYPCVAEAESPGNNEPDYVLEPGYIQMIAVICNRPGVAGFRLERPLLITETGNEVMSNLPFEPWIIDCGRDCSRAP